MSTPATGGPNTVRARILPGWMTRDEAVRYLTVECHPPMTTPVAEQNWQDFRDRCVTLPTGRAPAPQYLPLNAQEAAQAQKFTQFLNSRGPHQVSGAVKVDLRQLVA